jgi:hypothetical protein
MTLGGSFAFVNSAISKSCSRQCIAGRCISKTSRHKRRSNISDALMLSCISVVSKIMRPESNSKKKFWFLHIRHYLDTTFLTSRDTPRISAFPANKSVCDMSERPARRRNARSRADPRTSLLVLPSSMAQFAENNKASSKVKTGVSVKSSP